MKTSSRLTIVLFTAASAVILAGVAYADSNRTYNATAAKDFALANYNRPYGTNSNQNPFGDYTSYPNGANCTNFASQAIMAGMVGLSNVQSVYNERANYDVDFTATLYRWFWTSDARRGEAFTGAAKLYEYAVNNAPSYTGLHFTFVTRDSATTYLDDAAVQVGDIVFADWKHDGIIDHSMVVTRKCTNAQACFGYNKIRVTYQGVPDVVGKSDIGMATINQLYNYHAYFYVYRPTNYKAF